MYPIRCQDVHVRSSLFKYESGIVGGPTEVVDFPLTACQLVGDVCATPAPNVPVPSVHGEADCLGSHEADLDASSVRSSTKSKHRLHVISLLEG